MSNQGVICGRRPATDLRVTAFNPNPLYSTNSLFMWDTHAVCNLLGRQRNDQSQWYYQSYPKKSNLSTFGILGEPIFGTLPRTRLTIVSNTVFPLGSCKTWGFEMKFLVPLSALSFLQPLSAPPPTPSFVWFILEAMRPRGAPERDLSPVWVHPSNYPASQHSQLHRATYQSRENKRWALDVVFVFDTVWRSCSEWRRQ